MAQLLSGSHPDPSLDSTRELPLCIRAFRCVHDGAPAELLRMGRSMTRHAVGSLSLSRLVQFAALFLSCPSLSHFTFCVNLYWFIICHLPTGVTISALFSAPKYLFCNLIDSFVCVSRPQLIALPLGSPVRAPWDKSLLYRTRGSISPLSSNLFACVIYVAVLFSPWRLPPQPFHVVHGSGSSFLLSTWGRVSGTGERR